MEIDWKNWSIARILKIVFALTFLVLAITEKQWLFIFAALFFGIQGVLNMGCGCYSGNCAVDTEKDSDMPTVETKKLDL